MMNIFRLAGDMSHVSVKSTVVTSSLGGVDLDFDLEVARIEECGGNFAQDSRAVPVGFRDAVFGFIYHVLFAVQFLHESRIHCVDKFNHLHDSV